MISIYCQLTDLKGIASMKLHRDLGVTQKTASFIEHRIRESVMDVEEFAGWHNLRELDTIIQMEQVVAGMVGKRLKYKNLVSGEDGRVNIIESN